MNSFRQFLDTYIEVWKASSIKKIEELIAKDYQAREVRDDEIIDFGYEESIEGWKQGFHFMIQNKAQWKLDEISIFPLKDGETMVILTATLIVQGKRLETGNLFFQTFKKDKNGSWKLVRSYIESGIVIDNLAQMNFL
ncbi:flavoprotein [Psychrobacillus sp. L3]|uniref:flavoprotein n=1 Tax=Psychrobacillus sp. L3 TaxID=3236891 RepID=UPI0036F3A9B6